VESRVATNNSLGLTMLAYMSSRLPELPLPPLSHSRTGGPIAKIYFSNYKLFQKSWSVIISYFGTEVVIINYA